MLDTATQTTEPNTEPVTIPDDADVSHTAAFKGLLGDKQHETQRRQEAEQRSLDMQAELEELRGKKSAESNPEELPDTEILTAGDLKKIRKQEKEQQDKEKKQQQQVDMNRRFFESETRAKEKHTVESAGKGLDFDTVFQEGFAPLAKLKPHLVQTVAQDDNPAELAYTLGCTFPAIAQRIDAVRTVKLLEKLKSSGGSSRKGSGSLSQLLGQDEHSSSFDDLMDKPESELLKMIEEAED